MVKNIAIMDEVYKELVYHKLQRESFSKEIMRFLGKKGSILDLAGSWNISEEEANEIKKNLLDLKQKTTKKALRIAQG
ncbi:hypothetical protein J4410_05395 [Candidatus Woesearchaeota archaeon]|nr:hypothetical protein [Candidatus Woesearchaeota archaeon]